MSTRLFDALRAVLFATPAIPAATTNAAQAQSFPPVPAVPAAASKYDFQWEKYAVRTAPTGDALYVFEGQEPVGVLAKGVNGKPELFPFFAGPAGEELRASLKRYEDANGNGARPLAKKAVEAPLTKSPPQAATRGETTPVIFASDGVQVSLPYGTRVHFSEASVTVTMPSGTPNLPATTVGFASLRKEATTGQDVSGIAVTLNGRSLDRQRRGPVWEGIKALVLQNALGQAIQAARLASIAPGRPRGSQGYLVLVKSMESRLN